MTRILYTILFVGLAASLTACSDSLPLSSEAPGTEAVTGGGTGTIAYGRSDLSHGTYSEGSGALDEQFAALRSSVLALINTDAPLATRVRRVQRFLEINDTSAASGYVEQFAAVLLLRELLESDDKSVTGSISYFVELLTRNGSPEAPLVLEALKRLHSQWPSAKTSQAATMTAKSALAWVERLCAGCTDAEGSAKVPSLEQSEVLQKTLAITAAARELQEMASP